MALSRTTIIPTHYWQSRGLDLTDYRAFDIVGVLHNLLPGSGGPRDLLTMCGERVTEDWREPDISSGPTTCGRCGLLAALNVEAGEF